MAALTKGCSSLLRRVPLHLVLHTDCRAGQPQVVGADSLTLHLGMHGFAWLKAWQLVVWAHAAAEGGSVAVALPG